MYEGTQKLQSEGLDKLANEENTLISSLDDAMEVKDKLIDAADSYNNFTGLDKSMDGSVKFVMKVSSEDSDNNSTQEKNTNTKNDKSNNDKKSSSKFITWLKGLFNK